MLPTLLIDGYVAGVWRPAEGGIEATAFRRLTDDVWEQLAAEARSLTAFLPDREPEVYRRYDHWWSKLPSAEARLLPGDGDGAPDIRQDHRAQDHRSASAPAVRGGHGRTGRR